MHPILLLLIFPAAEPIDFVRDVRPILAKHCHACHGEAKQKSGLRLDVKSAALRGGEAYSPNIVPGKAADSPLIRFVSPEEKETRMPPEGDRLSPAEIATLTRWVNEGAIWPDGVDRVQLVDKTRHWSFQPVVSPAVPEPQNKSSSRGEIDRFILTRLQQAGWSPSPAAEPLAWLRRVTFDLNGLPPTLDEAAAFAGAIRRANETPNQPFEQVVDRLLQSPRYGERWAQHWLDVVRYADTHGFEVNTERPNAWPYRDYVIRAFNADTPYDRFIREQLIGDTLGQDAATGFLVTASVLLPGQIGKDAPSMRLARQDAIDEIVVNIGQTFLALSVGCARCHDHKFDPLTQRDYYGMQAFVAGVEYEDRPLRTPDSDAQQRAAAALQPRLAELDRQLARFVPLARVTRGSDPPARATDARLNTESFPPVRAKFVRFTIHDANLHPTLGLIEPCLDEFEIFTAEPEPRNVALATHGTKVTASGSRTSDIHRLEHIHDGRYGNSRSWMSDTRGQGWVLFELPAAERISKIVWSRDREGKFTDRLVTAFTLEAGESLDALQTLTTIAPPRPAVNARLNTDRFAPMKTNRLRFTITNTNKLEPCIDELEVFDTTGVNVALASAGTTVKSSGDMVTPDRHELRFLHDGRYGNSRSWLSSERRRGWVELTFSQPATIDRVVWSRDREGMFTDRLAIAYQIEITDGAGNWITVADSSDRANPDRVDQPAAFSTAGLAPTEAAEANRLLAERRVIDVQLVAAASLPKVFAGTFRQPDIIRLLTRGDPEQPKDEILPAIPAFLRATATSREPATSETARRAALADWLSSPNNPLTARVIVNRIWQGHFGTGLVETTSDFGLTGSQPSHPELLDWLASDFVRHGWSMKRLHRQIVLSSTYRQSSRTTNSIANASDADVRLLWRFPSRRLDAESIRDAMLAVSGRLNTTMYGRGFDLFDKRGGLSGFKPIESFSGDGLRRMIYAHKVRRERDAIFGAFDCPDAGQSTSRRRESTTPLQALNLFNSRFTLDQAAALATRIESEAGSDTNSQIQLAYQLILTREPTAEELADAVPVVRAHGLATLGRVLFNSNEFLFVP